MELEEALVAGLQLGALILWIGLLGRAIFRPQGWGQTYWGVSPELCRFMRRTLMTGCLAALLLLVPRHVLLAASGGPEMTSHSLALARLFFTAFQLILLGIVGIVGRRNSPLIQTVLASSRQQSGVLWRNWPLIYVVLGSGMLTVLALDLLGYRYAVKSLWQSSGESLLVIVGLGVLYSVSTVVIEHLARHRQQPQEQVLETTQASFSSTLQRGQRFIRLALVLIGVLAVLRLYHIDQNLLRSLDSVHLLEVGRDAEGQTLWMTLGDALLALLLFGSTLAILRNLPSLYEVTLFPRVHWDQGLRYAFLTLSRYGLLLVAIWVSLTLLHFRWSSIQWILAAVSVGLGFGLQEIVGNFVSGLILLTERPVSVGDFVTVGTQGGRVTRITIRATTVQNVNNQTVMIPNKSLITRDVINWTLGDTKIRVIVPISVAYGSDLDLVERLLTDVVSEHPKVLKDPPPDALFTACGESALEWTVRFVVPTPQDRLKTTHELLRQIAQKFHAHGVEIPFPQRDLHLRSVDPGVELLAPNTRRHSAATLLDDTSAVALPDIPTGGASRDKSH